MNGYESIVNYLTLRAKNLNVEDKEGHTLLMLYLNRGKMSVVSKLIIRGADINYQNTRGRSALHMAVEKKMKERIIRELLNEGANPHLEDAAGWDVCDKGRSLYPSIKEFGVCKPSMRVKFIQNLLLDTQQTFDTEDDFSPRKGGNYTVFEVTEERSDSDVEDSGFVYGNMTHNQGTTVPHEIDYHKKRHDITVNDEEDSHSKHTAKPKDFALEPKHVAIPQNGELTPKVVHNEEEKKELPKTKIPNERKEEKKEVKLFT